MLVNTEREIISKFINVKIAIPNSLDLLILFLKRADDIGIFGLRFWK